MKKSIFVSIAVSSLLIFTVMGCDLKTESPKKTEELSKGTKKSEIQTTKSGLKYQIHSVDESKKPTIVEYTVEFIDNQNSVKKSRSLSSPIDEMIRRGGFDLAMDSGSNPVVDTNGLFVEGLKIIKENGAGEYTLYLSYDNNIPPFSTPDKAVIPVNAELKFNIIAK